MGTGGLVVGGDLRLLVAEVVLHEPGDGAARVLGGGEEVGPQLRLLELARRHDLEGLEAGWLTISWVARLSLLVTIATTVFRMGSGSPVRLLSSTVKSEQVTSLTSAGIQSPMARLTRSPGTSAASTPPPRPRPRFIALPRLGMISPRRLLTGSMRKSPRSYSPGGNNNKLVDSLG